MYGVNALDILELPAEHFFAMTRQVDAARLEARKARAGSGQ